MPDAESILKSIIAVSAKRVFPDCYKEELQERAAIMQFDGGMCQSDALLRACDEINKRYLMKNRSNNE